MSIPLVPTAHARTNADKDEGRRRVITAMHSGGLVRWYTDGVDVNNKCCSLAQGSSPAQQEVKHAMALLGEPQTHIGVVGLLFAYHPNPAAYVAEGYGETLGDLYDKVAAMGSAGSSVIKAALMSSHSVGKVCTTYSFETVYAGLWNAAYPNEPFA